MENLKLGLKVSTDLRAGAKGGKKGGTGTSDDGTTTGAGYYFYPGTTSCVYYSNLSYNEAINAGDTLTPCSQ